MQDDQVYQLIEKIVMDKEMHSILFSYPYNGDHPLFIAYDDIFENAIDTTKYTHYNDWRYQINMKFSDGTVYVRNFAFLFSRLTMYYIQFDEVMIDAEAAHIRLQANTMDAKVDGLFYFVGDIRFSKKNGDWCITQKRLKEKD